MAVVLSIRKIILQNLGRVCKNVCTFGVKILFPLAARLSTIFQHWLILANFWDSVGGKLHERVTLWVLEIIRFGKRGKVLHELLYRLQKGFSSDGPNIGISQILSPNIRISQYLDRRGKNLFEVGRVARQVPSRVSRTQLSLKLTKLRVHEVCVPQSLKNWPKSVNVEKSPYVCRRGKNHFDPGGSHDFVPPPQISWYYLVIW